MTSIREMITKWGFKIEHEKLSRVEQQLEGIKRRLEFLGAVEVGKAVFEMVEKFSKFGEELHSVSSSIGLAVEDYQRLAFSASQASVSQEELGGSMRRLARQIYAAREGSEDANKSFQDLGIGPERVKSFKNAEEALLAVSDRMRAIDDPIKKAALAQQLLGRSSSHMVGYLSQGSEALKKQGMEADKLGIILSHKQVEALVRVENAFSKLWAVLKSISAIIAAEVAPVLEYLIGDFIKFFQMNRELVQSNIIHFLEKLAFAFGFVWEALKYGISLVKELAEKFNMDSQLLSLIGAIGGLVGGYFLLKKSIQAVIDTYMFLQGAMGVATKVMGFSWSAVMKLASAWNYLVAALGTTSLSLGVFLGLLALIFVAIHDIWEGIHGRPTWINGLMEMLGIADSVNGAFEKMFEWIAKLGQAGIDVGKWVGNTGASILTGGDSGALTPAMASSITSAGAQGGANYSLNAPINIAVPPGTDPADVGKHVGTAVKEHLDFVMRQANKSTGGVVAY